MDTALEKEISRLNFMPLSGKVWPIHFPPYQDEALTSWISRLAVCHCSVPSTFFAKTVPLKSDAWKQDLDVRCHHVIIEALSKKCCVPISRVEACTTQSEIEKIYIPSGRTTALPRWVSPARIRRKTDHHFGMKFCVRCILENPYFKLRWRLSFYIVCLKHSVRMLDSCESCGASVSSHRISVEFFEEFPIDALAFCDVCGFDLRFSKYEFATDLEIDLMEWLVNLVDQGSTMLKNGQFLYSHLYFQGFRLLLRGILKLDENTCWVSLGEKICLPKLPNHFEIEFLRVSEIRSAMLVTQKLLDDWPERFISFSEDNGLFYQNWVRPRDLVPYWFYVEARRFRK